MKTKSKKFLEIEIIVIKHGFHNYGDTRLRFWLRHCAKSREVAGSIPDGINGICH